MVVFRRQQGQSSSSSSFSLNGTNSAVRDAGSAARVLTRADSLLYGLVIIFPMFSVVACLSFLTRDLWWKALFLGPSTTTTTTTTMTVAETSSSRHNEEEDEDDPDAISCQQIYANFASTTSTTTTSTKTTTTSWRDPNKGEHWYRDKLVSEPSFAMAVHTEAYDPVRWKHIYINGRYYETLVHERFLEILTPAHASLLLSTSRTTKKSLVLDVGANIGYYTLLARALGYPVYAFEINPPNLLRICESLDLNHWNNNNSVHLYQKGVSDHDGETLEVWVPRNPGQAFLRPPNDPTFQAKTNQAEHHDVATTLTLDRFAKQRGWLTTTPSSSSTTTTTTTTTAASPVSIRLLKLDVEGKEPLVIAGALELLKSGVVENVLTEFRRFGREGIQQAIRSLLDSGFTLVDETEGKVSQTRSRELLKQLEQKLRGKMTNVDLWFQRV